MKIISGLYKGRNLLGYNIEGTRPTMDRIKESLFAIIQDYIDNSIVLDLFSGSGNLGIESLSNGAKYAYLVDNNKKAISIINKNIENLKIENVRVLNQDFKKALFFFYEKNISFDIILLDPPYRTNYIEESIEIINRLNLLNDNGIIVSESSNIEKIKNNENYKIVKEKKYGDKYIVILSKI